MTEEWRQIEGYAGLYDVSNLGRVRSYYRGGRILSTAATDETGYPVVALTRDGKRHTYTVHRLVCRAFHGPCPADMQSAHLDGDKTNAHADNLKWCNKVENEAHKRGHGTRAVGEAASGAKLTETSVRAILNLLAEGVSCRAAGERFGVTGHAIADIRRRKNWRHIVGPTAAYGRAARAAGDAQPSSRKPLS